MMRMPGLGDAGARRARPRARGDGLGHPARGRAAVPAARRPLRAPRGRRPLRPHRAARRWWRPRARVPRRRRRRRRPAGGRPGAVARPAPAACRAEAGAEPSRRPSTWLSPQPASASPCTSCATGDPAPARCCCCTASASAPRRRRRRSTDGWPGPVYGLDFTGHGASTVPVGGGYSAEMLLADADTAAPPPRPGHRRRPGPRRLHRPARRRRPARPRARRRAASTVPG